MPDVDTIPPRAQFRRVLGFKMAPGGVLCSRPGALGNPFRLIDPRHHPVFKEGQRLTGFAFDDPEDVLKAFRKWAVQAIKWQPVRLTVAQRQFKAAWPKVKKASKLYCFCRIDQPCHVDVIRDLLRNGY